VGWHCVLPIAGRLGEEGKEEGGRRKEEGGRRKEEGGRRKEGGSDILLPGQELHILFFLFRHSGKRSSATFSRTF
jgi:hypothetical protein